MTTSSLLTKIELMDKSLLNNRFPPDISGIYDEDLANQLAQTQGAIASLNQMTRLLHNPSLLMRPILAKEAESSAQLEGTQASIEDVYKIDILDQTPEEKNEALEIKNYESAMLEGLAIVKKYKLNNLTIRQVHKTLMRGVRGKNKHPGEFRKGDVWIGQKGTKKGSARYIPPDAAHVPALMDEFEKFLNSRGKANPLIAVGIAHHRFEAIHPFEDGNGRAGRLLISLYLIREGLLSMPILYPSGYFEAHKNEYMDSLSKVDKSQDWYSWLLFFLYGLEQQAKVALNLAIEIDNLFKRSKAIIENETAGLNLIRVLEYTFTQPYLTAPILSRSIKIPRVSCRRYLETLTKKRIIEEIGIYKKQRVYLNTQLVGILKKI